MFDKRKESNEEATKAPFDAGLKDQPASQPAASSGRAAVIGPRIRVNGDVSGGEDLIIEGTVQGKVDLADYRVEVGASGQVHADILAKVVKIDGVVEGDIKASEKVIIARSGNVRGNIVSPRMTLEDGAKFKGSIDMDPSDKQAAVDTRSSKSGAKDEAKAEGKPVGNGQGRPAEQAKPEGLALKAD
ncbi:MAG: polymer-forming cytoskeletal protein [Gammaproteobacteria bacterium]